jgi:BlaI family penicillinase repressor
MLRATRPRKPLSPLELLVMDAVWAQPGLCAEALCHSLASRHPMKESTARTMLKRLEQKGYLRRSMQGRTNLYRPCEQPEHLAAKTVRQIIDRWCGGSVERLLVGLVDHEVIDSRELRDLSQKIARRKAEGGT